MAQQGLTLFAFFVLIIRRRPPRAIIHLRYDDPDLASGILGDTEVGARSLVGGERPRFYCGPLCSCNEPKANQRPGLAYWGGRRNPSNPYSYIAVLKLAFNIGDDRRATLLS